MRAGYTLLVAGLLVCLAACDTTVAPDKPEDDCYYDPMWPGTCHRYLQQHQSPAWSPDGRKIAYIRTDYNVERWGLFVYDLEAETDRLVIHGTDNMGSQAWSPDGEWIAFGAGRQIYTIRSNGEDLAQLTFERENFDAAWSPDGEWISYTDATPSTPQQGTYILRPDGSEKQWLPHVRGGSPIWHPSSAKILTKGGTLPDFEYRLFQDYVSDPARRDSLKPAIIDGIIYSAAFSHDGTQIVYDLSDRSGIREIWTLNIEGGEDRKLTGTGGADPAWSPDGRTIAYVNIFWREGVIWLMDVDGSNKRRMGPEPVPISFPWEVQKAKAIWD